MSTIETLKKIQYQNLTQFQEEINANFAIIQNSPLFKGIPGEIGSPGIPGMTGIRGTNFLFIDFQKFQTNFPGELSLPSQIDLIFINNKLLNFNSKIKLLSALDISNLVDKDVIVLSNTIMLSYNLQLNKFFNTGISFNEQANLLNNIQQQIENAVQYYLSINPTLNSLSNTFINFPTLAKNYADTNNVNITTNITNTSVYSPFIQGFNSNIGIQLNNHKYFGFSDTQFPLNNNGTIVFGSIKKYYNLLMNTVDTDINQTLTSDYAPGVDNIPSMVVLQDTEKAGILIGYKGRQNLKRFGSIYKNNIHELILKTDSGINPSEFSELKLSKDYLRFAKLVQFGDDLEVSRDLLLFGDINNKFLRSGKFTNGADSTNNFNKEIIEIGRNGIPDTKTKIISDDVWFNNYIENVLVSDLNGKILKNYQIEKAILPLDNTINNLINLPINIGNSNNILTSNYFLFLCKKINYICNFVDSNYWKKSQFNTGEIPNLWLSNSLTVDKNVQLTGNFLVTNQTQNKLSIGSNILEILSNQIKLQNFSDNVLITENGLLSNNYTLEKELLNFNELNYGNLLTIFNESDNKILSTKYYAHLAKKINNLYTGINNNYWTKSDFNTGVIPYLYLNTGLIVTGGTSLIDNNGRLILNINSGSGLLTLGTNQTTTILNSQNIKFNEFKNNVLVTNNNGDLIPDYSIETRIFNDTELTGDTQISDILNTNSNNKIALSYHIRWIYRKLNNLITNFISNTWLKPQWITGEIPKLITNDSLETNGQFRVGPVNDMSFYHDGINYTEIGKDAGATHIKSNDVVLNKIKDKVLITNNVGKILDSYEISPESITSTTSGSIIPITENEIETHFYDKTQIQDFLNYPNDKYKILTGWNFNWLINNLRVIKKLIYNRPTYNEVNLVLPLGSIIYWNNVYGPIPTGWVVCDGRFIPGINQRTPNMLNKFVKGSLIPNTIGGNTNNSVIIGANNLPAHNHELLAHNHEYLDIFYSEKYGNVGVPGALGSALSDDDNGGYQISRTTASGGSGVTGNTGNNQPLNIEPYSITLIPIMKFWNGVGTMPVITMPAWLNITSIILPNDDIVVDLNINIVDATVTSCNVEGSSDGGTTWNILKNVSITSGQNKILGVPVNKNGQWSFRVRALNGDSYSTNGEISNTSILDIYQNWILIDIFNLINGDSPVIEINKIIDTSVTSCILKISNDNGTTWNDVGLSFDPTTLSTPYINDGNHLSPGTYIYKMVALNGNPLSTISIKDNESNITVPITITPAPVNWANFVNIVLQQQFDDWIGHGTHYVYYDVYFMFTRLDNTVTTFKLERQLSNGSWSTVDTINYVNDNYQYYTTFSLLYSNAYGSSNFRLKASNGSSSGNISKQYSQILIGNL